MWLLMVFHATNKSVKDPMTQTAIELIRVGKRYQYHWAIAPMDLTIQRGESVALFGQNGSGKSTLLRILATLVAPSIGQLKILGLEPKRHKEIIRKKIKFLGHSYPVYGSLTVTENLKLAASLLDLGRPFLQKQIGDILERFQIKQFHHHRVEDLSEGLRKRVVLARLLMGACDPELVLLDEPQPALDAQARGILTSLIEEWKKKGITLLIASHDHQQTLIHTERTLTLEGGRIL